MICNGKLFPFHKYYSLSGSAFLLYLKLFSTSPTGFVGPPSPLGRVKTFPFGEGVSRRLTDEVF